MMKAALRMYLIKGKRGPMWVWAVAVRVRLLLFLHALVISAEENHHSNIRLKRHQSFTTTTNFANPCSLELT